MYLNIMEPNFKEVDIETAARALSKVCRFGGHIGGPDDIYSVAQHCRYVSILAERLAPGCGLWGLLHDLPEFVVGDCVSPLKKQLRDFKPIEQRWMAQVCTRYRLAQVEPVAVTIADREVFIAEECVLRRQPDVTPTELSKTVDIDGIETPSVAYAKFMARFQELTEHLR